MKNCVLCGKVVEGTFHDVVMTICCQECCEKVSDIDENKRCCASRAMSFYGCRAKDLEQLNCVYARNPHYRRGPEMKLYLIAEVKYLGEKALIEKEATENLKRKKREEKLSLKRQRLENQYRVIVQEIPSLLRPFILGDYLEQVTSKTLLRDVRQRYRVKDCAQTLVETCKAHPSAAVDYLKVYPDGNVDHFQKLKDNMRKALHLEGNKILQMLSIWDREKLKQTPLNDIVKEFNKRKINQILIWKLKEHVDEKTAYEIARHPACQQRISLGGEESKLASKLLKFWESKNDRKKRETELRDSLNARGLNLRNDSSFCAQYISGQIDVDLEEIVGIMDITRHLFNISHAAWSNYRHKCEAEFKCCFVEQELDLDTSVKRALGKIPKSIPHDVRHPRRYRHDYDEDYDSDYLDY